MQAIEPIETENPLADMSDRQLLEEIYWMQKRTVTFIDFVDEQMAAMQNSGVAKMLLGNLFKQG